MPQPASNDTTSINDDGREVNSGDPKGGGRDPGGALLAAADDGREVNSGDPKGGGRDPGDPGAVAIG